MLTRLEERQQLYKRNVKPFPQVLVALGDGRAAWETVVPSREEPWVICVTLVNRLGHVVGIRRTGSVSTHWPPPSQCHPLYLEPSCLITKKDLGRRKEEAGARPLVFFGVDPSPRVAADTSRLLCPRAKNWTRDRH